MPTTLTATGSHPDLAPGFKDPVFDAQTQFRNILTAMSHPGQVVALNTGLEPPAPLSSAAAAVALTLVDFETPVWLDASMSNEAVTAFLRFHTGCPVAGGAEEARFAFIADGATPLDPTRFDLGTDEYPDLGATVVVQVPSLAQGADSGTEFSGPGIEDKTYVEIGGLADDFWAERNAICELFPRGLDILFTCGDTLCAVPRSTKVETLACM